jgi:hypothetical protein
LCASAPGFRGKAQSFACTSGRREYRHERPSRSHGRSAEQAQILHEDPERPAVGDDVVSHQHEDMIRVGDPEELRPKHGRCSRSKGRWASAGICRIRFASIASRTVHNPECTTQSCTSPHTASSRSRKRSEGRRSDSPSRRRPPYAHGLLTLSGDLSMLELNRRTSAHRCRFGHTQPVLPPTTLARECVRRRDATA